MDNPVHDISISRPWTHPSQPGYVYFVITDGASERPIRLSREANWPLYSFLLQHALVVTEEPPTPQRFHRALQSGVA